MFKNVKFLHRFVKETQPNANNTNSKSTIAIIVARHNENIDWTLPLPNVIIYNKGAEIEANITQISLKNVGREGHTYYRYIYDNYDKLEDFTIFLQGYPFDHSPHLLTRLNKYLNDIELNVGFEFVSEHVIPCNLSGCKWHSGLPLIDTYEQLFGERKINMEFEFGAGAQFIVSKKNILQRPREFYMKIIRLLQNDISPIEGYVIERFHKLILDPDIKQSGKST